MKLADVAEQPIRDQVICYKNYLEIAEQDPFQPLRNKLCIKTASVYIPHEIRESMDRANQERRQEKQVTQIINEVVFF